MIDLNKKYYAVHVQASNFLNGIHYIPFTDEDIERMQKEYETESPGYWFYMGDYLRKYMATYLKQKFGYDSHADVDFSVLIGGDFEPVGMDAIIQNQIGEDGGSLLWYDAETPIYKY